MDNHQSGATPLKGYVWARPFSSSFVSMALGLLCLVLACSSSGPEQLKGPGPDTRKAPKWVCTGEAPDIPGALCAVGIAGATYFRSDAVKKAAEEARDELARSVSVKVQTAMFDVETGGGDRKEFRSVMEVSSFVNEIILEGSRIVEVWHDEQGLGFAKQPGYTYALACIDSTSLAPAMPK